MTRVPFLVGDGFALALDGFMRRTRQGAQVSQSVLELDSPPCLDRLRAGLARISAKHPLLAAKPKRDTWTRLPYWLVPAVLTVPTPLAMWSEKADSRSFYAETVFTPEAEELLQSVMAQPLKALSDIMFNVRLDVVEQRNGRYLVALSWSHLLVDGKGAELLFAEIARLGDGVDLPDEAPPSAAPTCSLLARFRQTRPALDHLTGLQRTGTPSLNGPKPRRGAGRYEVVTLSPEESQTVRGRLETMGVALFPFTFFVACVARAQDRVFRHRGQMPPGYGISVPVQTRRRGARGPLFGNHVTVLYFHPRREHLGSLTETTAAMKAQFAAMTRAKVSESFNALLELMRRVPSRIFLWIIRAQFGGELCTCFHSYTGQFAPEMTHFAGARILNAYHLPCLSAPPGTGIFFGERGDRLNVTLSWREGVLTDDERQLMLAQLRADLLGEPEL